MLKIKCDDIGKRFIKQWIFKNFNYQFESGRSYAITGPNGSGKSTLAQILMGYLTPSSGKVSFVLNGKKVEVEDIFKHLGFASPYMQLIEDFTLDEMISYHFTFKEIIDDLSISDFKKKTYLEKSSGKQVKNFSSGMKQRLKLGLVFYSNCDLMILDEPTTNLDADGIKWYTEQVQQACKNKLCIISSNIMKEYEFCDERIDLQNL
ncbi:MAG: ATP-binding cassette domain-containing protein [Cyclobacteriaceae bacterium]